MQHCAPRCKWGWELLHWNINPSPLKVSRSKITLHSPSHPPGLQGSNTIPKVEFTGHLYRELPALLLSLSLFPRRSFWWHRFAIQCHENQNTAGVLCYRPGQLSCGELVLVLHILPVRLLSFYKTCIDAVWERNILHSSNSLPLHLRYSHFVLFLTCSRTILYLRLTGVDCLRLYLCVMLLWCSISVLFRGSLTLGFTHQSQYSKSLILSIKKIHK